MKKALGIFNAAEWLVIIISVVIAAFISREMKSPYKEIIPALPNVLWFSIMNNRIQKTDRQKKLYQARQTEYEAKYRRLLNMVGGDKSACDALISHSGIDNAIADLIRDRQ